MDKYITLHHGGGGKQMQELIQSLFIKKFGMNEILTDSALLLLKGDRAAFTTDSYIVDPLFFPGGDIGKLAVCGTVNDLAVTGAIPEFISASFIIEEGFPFNDLEIIVDSMADEALNAGVKIVTGDTKVVEKGKCDKIFITTSGVGYLDQKYEGICKGINVKPGNKLIVNGNIGSHAIAVLGAREQLGFKTEILSDCASLNSMINDVLKTGLHIHFMRDLTRGGLAAVLNELASITGFGIEINEDSIPVEEPVKGLCEILGFDPLYLANEGKALFVICENDYKQVLDVLQKHSLGLNSEMIGTIVEEHPGKVLLKTSIGGKRLVDMQDYVQLPRIC